MQYLPLFVSATLASMAFAFDLTDCDTGSKYNFGSGSGCQVHENGSNYSYSSDAGCSLHVYSGTNCTGTEFTISTQNVCTNIGFTSGSMACS